MFELIAISMALLGAFYIVRRLLRAVALLTHAFNCWRNTRLYVRSVTDAAGNQYLYEFALVPRPDLGLFTLHISQFDLGHKHVHIVERTITAAEFATLRPKLIEI